MVQFVIWDNVTTDRLFHFVTGCFGIPEPQPESEVTARVRTPSACLSQGSPPQSSQRGTNGSDPFHCSGLPHSLHITSHKSSQPNAGNVSAPRPLPSVPVAETPRLSSLSPNHQRATFCQEGPHFQFSLHSSLSPTVPYFLKNKANLARPLCWAPTSTGSPLLTHESRFLSI